MRLHRFPFPRTTDAGVVLLAAIALSGCAGEPAAAPEPEAKPSATATPTPTPTVMSTEEAAEQYLDIVCPVNNLQDPYITAYNDLANAGRGDIATVQAAATTLRDATQAAAAKLIDPEILWPAAVAPEVVHISNAYFGRIVEYNGIVMSKTYDEVMTIPGTEDPAEAAAAGPKVRTILGLSVDTEATCEGR